MTAIPLSNHGLTEKSDITGANDERKAETTAAAEELSKDDVFHLLQNERRRRVIEYLHEHDEGDGVDMRDAVESIAAREHDTTVQALRSKERQRVYIALYQSHLPKLDDAGLIDYDQRLGWIERTDATPLIERYVVESDDETDDDRGVPTDARATYAATGGGALLLALGLLNAVPLLTGTVVAVCLFALLFGTTVWNAQYATA